MGTTQSRDDTQNRKHRRKLTSLRSQRRQSLSTDVSDKLSLKKSTITANDSTSISSSIDEDIVSTHTLEECDGKKKAGITLSATQDIFWKKPKKPFVAYNKNDDKEYERQLRQHYVLKHILKGNTHVPVSRDTPIMILDMACGAGFWTLDMALEYPNAKVIGLDAFPERNGSHTSTIGAPNVIYKAGDLTSQLQLPTHSVDLIYQRDTSAILPNDSWPWLLSELKRVAKPGAYIQLVEYNFTLKDPGPVLALVNEWYKIASSSVGVSPSDVKQLNELLVKAGFEEVKETIVRVPIGEWHSDQVQKENGFLYKQVIKALFYSMKTWWVSELDVSPQEYDKVVNAALNEFDEQKSSIEWIIYTARKPF